MFWHCANKAITGDSGSGAQPHRTTVGKALPPHHPYTDLESRRRWLRRIPDVRIYPYPV